MFTLNRTRISSDEGFSVEFTREYLVHIRDDRRVRFGHEMLPRKRAIAIWRDSAYFDDPQLPVRTAETQTAFEEVVRAFEGIGYEVVLI